MGFSGLIFMWTPSRGSRCLRSPTTGAFVMGEDPATDIKVRRAWVQVNSSESTTIKVILFLAYLVVHRKPDL